MAERTAHLVLFHAIIVGQLDCGIAVLVAKTHESQRVLPVRHIASTQFLHAERLGVEIDAALQVADAQHGVQIAAHVISPLSDNASGSRPSRKSPAASAPAIAVSRSARMVPPASNAS